ncbi:fused MFS/spermidine synthase [Candidatus Amoebophilus asiaticus]|nr:fused MFS/spermidine synthase [Candidatus Amoebophilus asiaticus]
MAVELLGAKIITPLYGASLPVWSSVIGVTLGALAIGYFAGGFVSTRFTGLKTIFFLLLIAAYLIALMPVIAPGIMLLMSDFNIQVASLLSCIIFLMPPLIILGTISPILITTIIKSPEYAGRIAGNIYAISTAGGIISTFLIGFIIIPQAGISKPVLCISLILGVIPFIYLLFKKKILVLVSIIPLLAILFYPEHDKQRNKIIQVKYQSEGLMGQLCVMDHQGRSERRLLINRIPQTYVNVNNKDESLWSYVHHISTISGIKPESSKVLLLGFGGGTLCNEMIRLNFEVDVVELDARVEKIARSYFEYRGTGANIMIDDARHYVNITQKKYDIILIDLLAGEIQPNHLFTVEGFEKLKNIINDNALIIINTQGFIKGIEGKGIRSIYKTLLSVELNSFIYFNYYEERKMGKNDVYDIILVATNNHELDLHKTKYSRRNSCCLKYKFTTSNIISDDQLDLSDAIVLLDGNPILEKLNGIIIKKWRNKTINSHKRWIAADCDVPIYN